MKWSYRLGQWFGIGVDLHLSFLLLLGWIAWSTYRDSGSFAAALGGMLFVSAVFLFVVLHEYGHALTARRFGIRTRRITLYPIGGVAMLEGMPKRPREQLLIAIAGPAVNFVLAALIVAAMLGLGLRPLAHGLGANSHPLDLLLQANLFMGAFNLLPALPMDGGRVLRALLEMRNGPLRATEVAARVARYVAFGMGIFALIHDNPVLLAISVMVWFMAGLERRQAQQAEAMRAYAEARSFALQGSSAAGFVPRARPPSAYGPARSASDAPGVVIEVVEGPDGPRVKLVRE